MRIIDTHAHYDDAAFDADRDELLRSLPSAGIERVVNMGASLRGAAESLELARTYDHVYAGIGIHPDHVGVLERGTLLGAPTSEEESDTAEVSDTSEDAGKAGEPGKVEEPGKAGEPGKTEETGKAGEVEEARSERRDLPRNLEKHLSSDEIMELLAQLCRDPKVVTFGEIGLDYHWDVEPREIQQKHFAAQMRLAVELDLPINVHSRDAAQDTFDLIKREHAGTTGGIIHCYSGSAEMAKEYVKMGYFIGIGGVVTFKNAKTQKKVVEEIPLEYLVTETDAPYMAPTPYRGKRNSSLHIPLVIDEIARIKGMDAETVAEVLYENALRVYRWNR